MFRLYLLICIFRVLNTFLIQSYFDPDEFWQTLEPAYCSVFRADEGLDCAGFTWEWKRRDPEDPSSNFCNKFFLGPVRTYLSLLPTHMLYCLSKRLHLDSTWLVARGPMVLYALTVAAPTDFAVWYCAKVLYPSSTIPSWCLFASLSAWFNAFSMVRTFTNSQEAVLLMLSFCLVSPELLADSNNDLKQHTHRIWRARAAFFLGGISLAIRGTSVAAYVPIGMLLALKETSWWKKTNYLLSVCAMHGILGIGLAFVVDFWFFGFPVLPLLGNFHFNVMLNHATLYGSHPWHWYLTAGTPAVVGILLPFLMSDLASPSRWSKGQRNLWIVAIIYTFVMSIPPHKEFRFILPLLPVYCLLVGETLQVHLGVHRRFNLRCLGITFLVTANLIAVLYLGLFHQSGPVIVNREILRLAAQSVDESSPNAFETKPTLSIGYWTGSCHSTPLLSSLHSPVVHFETRTLDCSPSCRSNPNILCETEQFHHDPLGFLQTMYPGSCSTETVDNMMEVCGNKETLPSFVVTMSNYVDAIQDFLLELGFVEVGRYPHNISGARIASTILGEDFHKASHGHVQLSKHLEISIEEVVLFAHSSLQRSTVSRETDRLQIKFGSSFPP